MMNRKQLSILALFFVFAACKNDKPTTEVKLQNSVLKIDSLSTLIEKERSKLDSLQELFNEKDMVQKSDTIYFGPDYEEIPEPQTYVINAFKNQPELIPLEPVLGGEMQYRKITLLSDKWLYAMYDDGHIQGASIFSFRLLPNGDIEFKELLSAAP